jgi:phosphatidylglycerophosphatase A
VAEQQRGAAVWIATCGGVGYFPVAPGTAGSVVGVALVAGLARLPLERLALTGVLAAVGAGLFVAGVWSAGRAEKFFSRVDPGYVVIDEVVGQILAFLVRPEASWRWLLAGFVLFRVFDVLKPSPARRLERLPGGWGIMVDDVVAGAYSMAGLALLGFLLK